MKTFLSPSLSFCNRREVRKEWAGDLLLSSLCTLQNKSMYGCPDQLWREKLQVSPGTVLWHCTSLPVEMLYPVVEVWSGRFVGLGYI